MLCLIQIYPGAQARSIWALGNRMRTSEPPSQKHTPAHLSKAPASPVQMRWGALPTAKHRERRAGMGPAGQASALGWVLHSHLLPISWPWLTVGLTSPHPVEAWGFQAKAPQCSSVPSRAGRQTPQELGNHKLWETARPESYGSQAELQEKHQSLTSILACLLTQGFKGEFVA